MKIISLFRSLRSRLTLAFIGLAIGPIVVVGLVLSYKSIGSLKNEAIAHQQIEAERISIAVENYVRELERILELTSQAHGFMSLMRKEQQSILEELIAFENRFQALTLVDSDGNELIHSNRIQVVTKGALGNRAHDPVFLQVVKLNKNYFSPVQFDTVTGEPRMTIAIPLQSFQTGDIEFVLFGSIRLKQIWDLLASISHTDQSIFLVDGKGNIIGHPDPSVTLSGQQFQLPVASSGIGTGLNGGEVVMATKKLVFGEQSIYVVAQMEIAKALRLSREIIIISLLVVVIALILAAFLSSLVIGAITRPLEHLASVAHTIQQGDLDRRVEYGRDDEVGELGRAFNDMTARLQSTIENLEKEIAERNNEIAERNKAEQENIELTKQLQQAQKMESIGTLAGGIAHDFNNILSSIIGFTELALEASPKDSAQRDDLEEVYTAGNRAKELVKQILAFARQSEERMKPVRVSDIVTETLKLLRPSTPTNIDIKPTINSTAKVMGNSSQLHQIVMNLCTNAIHSLEKTGGLLEIDLRDTFVAKGSDLKTLDLPAGEYVELIITDNGSGIDSAVIEKIFEPYFTTKGVGEGSGMGLAMVKGIVESYSGDIRVKSRPGETSFVIRLPITAGTSFDVLHQTEPVASGTERILFVDDEPPIARMGSRMLESLGYTVTVRTLSFEALELFRENPDAFDLVITDMTMPSMTGDVLSVELRKISHDIPIILCTGYSNKINEEGAKLIGLDAFAYKPFTKPDLAKTIREVLDKKQTSSD